MPMVRRVAGAVVRALALLVLCAVVVGCAVWGADRWGDAARRQTLAESRAEVAAPVPTDESDATDFPNGPEDIVPLLPDRDAVGDISVRVRRVGAGDDWRITSVYRLSLNAKDPLVPQLRADPARIAEVLYIVPGGYATAEPVGRLAALRRDGPRNLAGLPTWCTVSQPAGNGRVRVSAEQRTIARDAPPGASLAQYNLAQRVPDGAEGIVPRLPGRWTWHLDVPREWGLSVDGRPDRQTAGSVRFHLTPSRGTAAVTASFLEVAEAGPEASTDDTAVAGSRHQALLCLLVLFLAAGGTLTGLRRAPGDAAGTRRRRRTVVLGTWLLLSTALGALLWDLYQPNWSVLGWMTASIVFDSDNLRGQTLPIEARVQGVLLGVLLFALPVLVTAAGYRSRTSLPPPVGTVLAVAAPAPALVLLAWIMGGRDWTGPVVTCLVCASLAAAATFGFLQLLTSGQQLRPWAALLAVTVWAGVASAVVLQALPRNLQRPFPDETLTHLALIASWAAVFVALIPWVAAVLLLGGGPLPPAAATGPRRVVIGAVLLTALVPWWTPLQGLLADGSPAVTGLLIQLTGQSPGDQIILGLRVMAPALQTGWLACTALLLLRLRNTGTESGTWAPTARGRCAGLLVLAAAATVIGAPEAWMPHWTTAAALCTAWAGGLLLLPPGRAEQAARLHALSGADHARLVTSLARALLFAEGRHRFLTSSRATLADASLPADSWEEKWRSLKDPTSEDTARETTSLRAAALGGSAGRSAWSNGLTAAAATALLTLPWTTRSAWQAHGYSGLPEAVTVAGGPTCVWLAHGFTYGYLYPWLRGNGPVAKAGWMWVALTPVQLLLLVPKLQIPSEPNTLTVFLLLAQSAVMALGLGLYWEIRLVRRADLLWGHIRNFRRLSSLATPVSAVLVAAIAAAVTVLATAWANNVTAPVETPSPSSSAPSATPAPDAPP
ncbi:hypothetical protein ABZ953_09515 [Streptomyces sp. NPDC046465]|uniref:hypothetical protein n=1 Tax=Streptomyces sp. NPDC046465 TaxID=3155810 RepID=UPI003400DF0B